MEYGLWQGDSEAYSADDSVLILVLMEYGLWQNEVSMAENTLRKS